VVGIALWSLLVGPAFPSDAGELSDARRSVRESGEEDPEEKPRKRRRRDDDCEEETRFSIVLGRAFGLALTSPFWGPHVFLEDDLSDHHAIVPRPYDDAPFARQHESRDDPNPPLFGRIQWQGLTDFGDLSAFEGQALIETPWRLGIDTTFGRWQEDLPAGDDQLWLGDFNIVYRFAESEDIHFRSGIGMNWLNDAVGSDTGFNFTYGIDYYPRRPWVVSTTFDLGTLGEAGLFHNQTTIGLVWDRFEVFTGYEFYSIGEGDLHGWINGVRIRF